MTLPEIGMFYVCDALSSCSRRGSEQIERLIDMAAQRGCVNKKSSAEAELSI